MQMGSKSQPNPRPACFRSDATYSDPQEQSSSSSGRPWTVIVHLVINQPFDCNGWCPRWLTGKRDQIRDWTPGRDRAAMQRTGFPTPKQAGRHIFWMGGDSLCFLRFKIRFCPCVVVGQIPRPTAGGFWLSFLCLMSHSRVIHWSYGRLWDLKVDADRIRQSSGLIPKLPHLE
jgi:hypothetical protein